jgi:hypothetical protein
MDIQITGAYMDPDGQNIIVTRDITHEDGTKWEGYLQRFPKESLAIRAAEYNLEPDDPRVLDILLMEFVVLQETIGRVHPLYREDTIEEALAIVEKYIDDVKTEHGAPTEPKMRSLFHAADSPKSTQGLTDTKAILLEHADPDIGVFIKMNRDEGRKVFGKLKEPETLFERTKNSALATVWDQALTEDKQRQTEEVE